MPKQQAKKEYELVNVKDDDNDDDLTSAENEPHSGNKTTKEITFGQWLCSKPLSKGPFLYMVALALLSLGDAVFYVMDPDTAFIVSGVIGLSVCVYALKHFTGVLSLKAEVDVFGQLNRKFSQQHRQVTRDVDNIRVANTALQTTHQRLAVATQKSRENLTAFKHVEEQMKKCGQETFSGLQTINDKFAKVESRWHEELFSHQRTLLIKVFDRVEMDSDSGKGMNKDEFAFMASLLPVDYAERFKRLDVWNKFSRNGLIDFEDFRAALDLFAEMATDDVDIEFEIEKAPMSADEAHEFKRERARTRMSKIEKRISMVPGFGLGLSNQTFLQGVIIDEDKESENDESVMDNDEFGVIDSQETIDEEEICYNRRILVKKRTEVDPVFTKALYEQAYSDYTLREYESPWKRMSSRNHPESSDEEELQPLSLQDVDSEFQPPVASAPAVAPQSERNVEELWMHTTSKFLRQNLKIKDRKQRMKAYHNCFIGKQAVKKAVSLGITQSETQAVAYMQKLMKLDIIEHVAGKRKFVNGNQFYRFVGNL